MLLPVVLCLLFLLVPFAGILVGADWASFPTLLASDAARDALRLSAETTCASTLVSMLLGVPLAYWLAAGATASPLRQGFTKVIRTLVSLPIVLPPVVAGLALLLVFGRRGLLGSHLSAWGIEIGFTTTAVVIAQVFVAMPYLVVSLEGALRTRGFDLEETAYQLGASRSRILWTITLPLTAPAITSGTAMTFSRALGEFGATLTFAGSLQGTTRTLPLEIYLERESDTQTALSLAIVLIAVACAVVGGAIFLTGRWQARLFPAHVAPDTEAGPTLPGPGPELRHRASAPGIDVDARVEDRGFDVHTSFGGGAVTALVGPNGSGKSTLIGLVSGSVRASSGGVTLTGASRGAHIVVLSQRALLFPHMSVLDNVSFGPRATGTGAEDARARAREELAALGIAHLATRKAPQLSGGQAQRVAIARAMATDPEVLLLDEPMAALDASVAVRLRSELSRRLSVSATTVLMATHDPADVAALARDVCVLHHGHVTAQGPWHEVLGACDDDFILALTGRHALDTKDGRHVVGPLDLRLARAGESGVEVVVEGTTWESWGQALVGRTRTGELVPFPVPAGPRPAPHAGDVVVLALADEARAS